jgi:phosphoribosylglycinamide formyltransferase-1
VRATSPRSVARGTLPPPLAVLSGRASVRTGTGSVPSVSSRTSRDSGHGGARLAVLVSGSGTILEAIMAAELHVRLVLTDRPCRAVEVASAAGIPTRVVDRTGFGGFGPGFERDRFTEELTAALQSAGIDVVAMAGFGTVLGRAVHDAYPGRILNTHPAMLPAFPGWHAVADALAAGVTETGTTVHIATLEMDSGPVLAQRTVPVLPGDTEATLHERIKVVERSLYPETIRRFVDGLASTAADGPGSAAEVAP